MESKKQWAPIMVAALMIVLARVLLFLLGGV